MLFMDGNHLVTGVFEYRDIDMAKHLKCHKDPKHKYLDKLKISAKNGDFFGGMKNYKNMTVFDNQYAADGKAQDGTYDWALFWIKCYSGKNKEKQKKVY